MSNNQKYIYFTNYQENVHLALISGILSELIPKNNMPIAKRKGFLFN